MSENIDERIVQMKFENQQFEQGVNQTVQSMDKLKKSLDINKEVNNLDNTDLSKLTKSIDNIEQRYTSFIGQITQVAMNRAANYVVNLGERIAKTLTVGQIFSGKSKYEQKTSAVYTIKSALPDTDLDEIYEQLANLNKYTDETSYDFVEMVNSIGKFTANGIGLKEAVEAMKGIGNEAAKSGAGIQQANRAMYNFSQALAMGSVKVQDWMSIENANMATKEFKEQIIETAVELGQLKKVGDKITTKRGTKVDFQTFRSTLSESWFTSDVLVKVLGKYADRTTEFGNTAFLAAQQATTLTQAIQAIYDAVSTQWMQSFEYIFGNLDESIELWTGFCNRVIEITDITDSYRNEILKLWHDSDLHGRKELLESIVDIFESLWNVVEAVSEGFMDVIPPPTVETLYNVTAKVREFADYLHDIFYYVKETEDEEEELEAETHKITDGLNQMISVGSKTDKEAVKELQNLLVSWGYDIGTKTSDGIYGPKTTEAVKKLQADLGVAATGVWNPKLFEIFYSEEQKAIREKLPEELNHSLEKGANGEGVKKLQKRLIDLGYDLGTAGADGIYGPQTEKAVKELQKDITGVLGNGIWNPEYWDKTFEKTFEKGKKRAEDLYKDLEFGATGEDVEKLNKKFKELGYTITGPMDKFSHETNSAVLEWQKLNGYEPTGIITAGQQMQIFAEATEQANEEAVGMADLIASLKKIGSGLAVVFQVVWSYTITIFRAMTYGITILAPLFNPIISFLGMIGGLLKDINDVIPLAKLASTFRLIKSYLMPVVQLLSSTFSGDYAGEGASANLMMLGLNAMSFKSVLLSIQDTFASVFENPIVQETLNKWGESFTQIRDAVMSLWESLTLFFGGILQAIFGTGDNPAEEVTEVADALEETGDKVEEVADKFSIIQFIAEKVGVAFQWLANAGTEVNKALTGAIDVVQRFFSPFKNEYIINAQEQFKSLGDLSEIDKLPVDKVKELQQTLQTLGLYSGDIDGIWGELSAGAYSAFVGKYGEEVAENFITIYDIWDQLKTSVVDFYNRDDIQGYIKTISDALTSVWETLKTLYNGVKTFLGGLFDGIFKSSTDEIDETTEKLNVFQVVLNGIGIALEWISKMASKVGSVFDNVTSRLGVFFKPQTSDLVKSTFKLIESGDIAGAQNNLNQLGYFGGVFDGLLNPETQSAIDKFKSDFAGMNDDTMTIYDVWQKIVAKGSQVYATAGKIVDTVQRFLSPSMDSSIKSVAELSGKGVDYLNDDEKKALQTQLKNLGYYNGAIDGIFGEESLKALSEFNDKFGDTARDFFSITNLIDWITAKIDSFWNSPAIVGIRDFLDRAGKQIQVVFGNAWTYISKFFSKRDQISDTPWENEAVSDAYITIYDVWDSIVEKVSEYWGYIERAAKQLKVAFGGVWYYVERFFTKENQISDTPWENEALSSSMPDYFSFYDLLDKITEKAKELKFFLTGGITNGEIQDLKLVQEHTGLENITNKDTIKQYQTVLKQLGLYKGEIDGIYGKETQAAMEQFNENYETQYKNLHSIREPLEWIKSKWEELTQSIGEFFARKDVQATLETINTALSTIGSAFVSIWNTIVKIATVVKNAFVGAVTNLWNSIFNKPADAAEETGEKVSWFASLLEGVGTVLTWIAGIATKVAGAFAMIGNRIGLLFNTDGAKTAEELSEIIQNGGLDKDYSPAQTKSIQNKLSSLGYDIKVDGVMGPETREALEQYSKDYGNIGSNFMTILEVWQKVQEIFSSIGSWFLSLFGIGGEEKVAEETEGVADNLEKVGDAAEKIEEPVENVSSIFERISKAWNEFFGREDVQATLDWLKEKFEALKATIKSFFEAIGNFFKNKVGGDFLGLSEDANAFDVIAAILGKIVSVVGFVFDAIAWVFETIGGVFNRISGNDSEAKNSEAAAKTAEVAGKSVNVIAEVIGGIAEAIRKVWDSLKWALLVGVFVVTVVSVARSIVMISKAKAMIAGKGDGIEELGEKMVKIGAGIFLIMLGIAAVAVAIKMIGGMDLWSIVKGLVVIAAIVVGMVYFYKLLRKEVMNSGPEAAQLSKRLATFGKAMIGIAAVVVAVAIVAKIFGSMSWSELARAGVGLLGVIGFLSLLFLAMKLLNKTDVKVNFKGLTQIASTILLLAVVAVAVGWLAQHAGTQMLIGFGIVIGIMGLLLGFVKLMQKIEDSGKNNFNGKSLIKVALTVVMFAAAIAILGSMPVSTLIKGGIATVAIMAVMLGFIWLMSQIENTNVDTKAIGKIILIAGVVLAIGYVVSSLLAIVSSTASEKIYAFATLMGVMTVLFISVAGASILISKINTKTMWSALAKVAILSLIVVGIMAAVSLILNIDIGDPDTALKKVMVLAALMGIVTVVATVLVLLGSLMMLFGAYAIGVLITGIIAFGLAIAAICLAATTITDVINDLPDINEKKLKTFKDVMGALVDIQNTLSEESVGQTIVTAIFGSELSHFGNALKAFAPGFKELMLAIDAIDIPDNEINNFNKKASAMITVTKDIKDLSESLGGVRTFEWAARLFAGGSSMDYFVKDFTTYVDAMKSYYEGLRTNGFTVEDATYLETVTSSIAAAGTSYNTLAVSTMGYEGGDGTFVTYVRSFKELTNFGEDIKGFATAMQDYAGTLKSENFPGLAEWQDDGDISKLTTALVTIATKFSKELLPGLKGYEAPDGTFYEYIRSGSELKDLGDDMTAFANGMAAYYVAMQQSGLADILEGSEQTGFEWLQTATDNAIAIADPYVKLIGDIKGLTPFNSGDASAASAYIASYVSCDAVLTDLIAGMESYATGLIQYYTTMQNSGLADISTETGESGLEWLKTASENATAVAGPFVELIESLAGIGSVSSDQVSSANDIVSALQYDSNTTLTSLINGMKSFMKGMVEYGKSAQESGLGELDENGKNSVLTASDNAVLVAESWRDFIVSVNDKLKTDETEGSYDAVSLGAKYAAFGTGLANIGSGIAKMMISISTMYDTISIGGNKIPTSTDNDLFKKVTTATETAKKVIEAFKEIPEQDTLSGLLDKFGFSNVDNASQNLSGFAESIIKFINAFEDENGNLKITASAGTKQGITEALGIIKQTFEDFAAMAKLFAEDGFATYVNELTYEAEDGADASTEVITEYTSLTGILQEAVKAIVDFFSADIYEDLAPDQFYGFEEAVDMIQGLNDLLTTLNVDDPTAGITRFLDGIDQLSGKDYKFSKEDAENISTYVGNVIGAFNNSVTGEDGSIGTESTGTNMVAGIANGINGSTLASDAMTSCINAVISAGKTAAGTTTGSSTKSYSIGNYIVQGLKDGVSNSDSRQGAIDAFGLLVQKMIEKGEEVAGINSPSKITKADGAFLVLGLASGIIDEQSTAVNAMGDMTESVINAAQLGMLTLNDVLASEIDTTPVIAPVLDLSNVANGANAIDSMMHSSNIDLSATLHKADNASESNMRRSHANQNGSTTNNYNNNDSVTVTGNTFTVREEADIDKISKALMRRQHEKQRAFGAPLKA